MATLSTLEATVATTASTYPGLEATASVEAATDPCYLDVTIDDSAAQQALGNEPQIAGLSVTFGGTAVDAEQLGGAWTVTHSLGEMSTWQLQVNARRDHPLPREWSEAPGGSPLNLFGAPPPGKAAVNVSAIYGSDTGPVTIPLITNGVADAYSRQTAGTDEATLSGLDAGGRYDRKKVTLTLPPGHGLARGDVIRKLATLAGITTANVPAGATCYKEVSAVDEEWFGLAREIADVEGWVLEWDASGVLTAKAKWEEAPTIKATLTEAQLLTGGISVNAVSECPNVVTITGTEQIVSETCQRVTKVTTTETYGYRTVAYAKFGQNADGTLAAQAYTDYDRFELIERQVVEVETECGATISQRVRRWGWYNPIAARYTIDTGAVDYIPNVWIFDAGATQDDQAQAYTQLTAVWCLVSDALTTYTYDTDDYLTTETIGTGEWRLERSAVQEWNVGTSSWDLIESVYMLGDGTGVTQDETFYPIPSSLTSGYNPLGWDKPMVYYYLDCPTSVTLYTNSDGYLTETAELSWGLVQPLNTAGFTYKYADGSESSAIEESIAFAEATVTRYAALSESQVFSSVDHLDQSGQLIERETVVQDGYLPAATMKEGGVPDSSVYDTEDVAEPAAASRNQSKQIKVQVTIDGLEDTREVFEVKTSSQWAENEDELVAIAVRMIREGSASTISWSQPFCAILRPGDWVHVSLPEAGIEHDVHLLQVTHSSAGWEGPITTQCQGRIYYV